MSVSQLITMTNQTISLWVETTRAYRWDPEWYGLCSRPVRNDHQMRWQSRRCWLEGSLWAEYTSTSESCRSVADWSSLSSWEMAPALQPTYTVSLSSPHTSITLDSRSHRHTPISWRWLNSNSDTIRTVFLQYISTHKWCVSWQPSQYSLPTYHNIHYPRHSVTLIQKYRCVSVHVLTAATLQYLLVYSRELTALG